MTGLGWVVLAVVLVLLGSYFLRCLTLIRSEQVARQLHKLRTRFEREIQDRVARGQNPDWLYYTDEASREQEAVRESLRTYGTIALATGVGGTMLALVLYLLFGDTTTATEPLQQLLREMGAALIASLLGVADNVLILWVLLPWANRRFDAQLEGYLRTLRRIEEETSPDGSMGEVIGARIGVELRSAITRMPESFERLEKAASELGQAVGGFEASVAAMTSVAGDLSTSVSDLSGVPRELESVLEQARSGWSGEVGKVLDAVRIWETERLASEDEWRTKLKAEVTRVGEQQGSMGNRLVNATGDVAESVKELPGGVAEAVERIAGSLGTSFGHQAQAHVVDLRDAVKGTALELQRSVEAGATNLQHHMTDLVERTLRDLEDVSRKLTEVLRGFPEHVGSVTSALDEADGKLREVAEFLGQSAAGLAGEHESTRVALARVEAAVYAEVKAIKEVGKALKRSDARRGIGDVVRRWFGRAENNPSEET